MSDGYPTAGVLGGVIMPHAPQFFTLPDTEDKATVDRVSGLAAENGRRLAELAPDVWVICANDHANQFFLHCTPPFTLHVGGEVSGHFAGRNFHYRVASDLSLALLRRLQDEGFDPAFTSTAEIDYAFGIPMTFLGIQSAVIPLYVNSYVPPQPSMERCYQFGRALARGLAAVGKSAVIVASGGMSHFPGTERYAAPDVEFDRALFARLAQGNLRALLALDERTLDDHGNVELRSWAIAAGMLGERKPDAVQFEPSWHHIYATLAFYRGVVDRTDPLHYPNVHPERVKLTEALHRLANDASERARYFSDPLGYAAALGVSPLEAKALATLDQKSMVALGVHPLVPFLAKLQLDRQREQ
jgi:2,3-dihydroxyphenylpropionate 1,2-dioxygenase